MALAAASVSDAKELDINLQKLHSLQRGLIPL